ncbi:ABC-type multidrug transport system ATPase subunit [Arcanobacterium pluranimalium]|uniref:ATP-binding cassette domain-containing protein n=1 Tax=Arcanobacterium pluranimalium TaxID=108028 RepID=UPI00195A1B3F|nr:ABC-type multidrug transport system ATPase subunit [Arcanobacterium pluranimalium]
MTESENFPLIEGRSVLLNGPRGAIIEPLDFSIEPGTLTLFLGHAGSGRTSLLLALTGRLKLSEQSQLHVLGHELPHDMRAVRNESEIIGIHDLDQLDEQVTIGATIRERLSIHSRAWTHIARVNDAKVREVLTPIFGTRPIPRAKDLVYELSELDNLLFRIALAMIAKPQILAVDNLDSLHEDNDRAILLETLKNLTSTGVTVVASATGEEALRGTLDMPHNIVILNNSSEER